MSLNVFLFYIFSAPKIDSKFMLYFVVFCTRQTSEQFFTMKYAFDTIFDGSMSFSIKNYA